jgi:hypothetical protein
VYHKFIECVEMYIRPKPKKYAYNTAVPHVQQGYTWLYLVLASTGAAPNSHAPASWEDKKIMAQEATVVLPVVHEFREARDAVNTSMPTDSTPQ